MTDRDKLLHIKKLWDDVRPIKNRCHNATPEDMEKVRKLVTAYHEFTGKLKLKMSACSIPNTIQVVGKLLAGHGIIEKQVVYS